MKTVQTVTGPKSTDQLGSVLMHEHVASSSMGIATHYPQFYHENIYDVIEKDLLACKKEGILTVIDGTPVSLGRDVRLLKKVSEDTGVNIIATAGWWGMEPPYLGPSTEEQWAQCFIDDIRIGCDGTDIRAGILKGAMDKEGPNEWNRKMHHAAAMASAETGVPIFLHTYCPTETPRHQLKFLLEAGADPCRIEVGHILETVDLDFVKWVYDQGVWLGLERIPNQHFEGEYCVTTESRIKFIKQILDAGMGDRVLFSHDLPITSTLFDNQSDEVKAFIEAQKPDHLLFIKKHVFPKLAEMGLDPDYLWKLTIDNPKRFFEG